MSTPWLSCAEAHGIWTGGSRVWCGAYTVWKKGNRNQRCNGFYFEPKVKLNQTTQIGTYISGKIYFTNKGRIRILKVCVIAMRAAFTLSADTRLNFTVNTFDQFFPGGSGLGGVAVKVCKAEMEKRRVSDSDFDLLRMAAVGHDTNVSALAYFLA
jgi:hypothetical protein